MISHTGKFSPFSTPKTRARSRTRAARLGAVQAALTRSIVPRVSLSRAVPPVAVAGFLSVVIVAHSVIETVAL